MKKFNKGEYVQLGIDRERFERQAIANSSTKRYITHIANGGIAKVISTDDHSLRLSADELDDHSNWFRVEWFAHADMALHQIKQDSQRL